MYELDLEWMKENLEAEYLDKKVILLKRFPMNVQWTQTT